ncbi:12077_t:CDS:1, partial [Dentiscutata heterogama]
KIDIQPTATILEKSRNNIVLFKETMKLEIIKNLYTKPHEEVNRFHDEQKSLTLKIDKHIAEYI